MVADARFSCVFCIALAVPLVMLGSIARSVDPRVGPRLGAEAATDTPRLCQAHGSSEALDSFPYGASAPIQVRSCSFQYVAVLASDMCARVRAQAAY